jgi:hypothetical protein
MCPSSHHQIDPTQVTLKMSAVCLFETSELLTATWCRNPKQDQKPSKPETLLGSLPRSSFLHPDVSSSDELHITLFYL